MLQKVLDYLNCQILGKDAADKFVISGLGRDRFLYPRDVSQKLWYKLKQINILMLPPEFIDYMRSEIKFKSIINDELDNLILECEVVDPKADKFKEKKQRVKTHELLSKLRPLYDVNASEIVLSKKDKNGNEVLSEIAGQTYMDLSGLSQSELGMDHETIKIRQEYVPLNISGILENTEDDEGVPVFNTYVPPIWFGEKIKPISKPPAIYAKLRDHLFPYGPDRIYFDQWLAESIFGRCPTILIMRSTPGAGKSTLKEIVFQLHGARNAKAGKQNTLEGKFNSQVKNTTMLWFDEGRIEYRMDNFLKTLPDKTGTLEEKGKDTKEIQYHMNVVFTNNEFTDNFVQFDARKYVALYMTAVRLENIFSQSDFDLIKLITNRDKPNKKFFVELVSYLKGVKRPTISQMEYKGPAFWRLCYETSPQWQKVLLDILVNPDFKEAKSGSGSSAKPIYNKDQNAFAWTDIKKYYNEKMAKRGNRIEGWPQNMSRPEYFLETFRDTLGQKCFETERVPGRSSGDMWIRQIVKEVHICTEKEAIKLLIKEKPKLKKKEDWEDL